ncbi:MAG: hypothetical protein C0501_00365 [Isosphaera sp.]|nr:hypothetical protein [Isosphaera sp.]
MHAESDFLRTLLENPADDTARLVYADWLDENGGDTSCSKAEFLRLTARLLDPDRHGSGDERLRQLAAELDTDWLAVVSRLKVEGCGAKRAGSDLWERYRRQFEFVCDRRWDEMSPTGADTVRFCGGCREKVHYCDTITTAREHAGQGHCVAVDLGIRRREGDLDPPVLMLGRPGPEFAANERKRLEVDPVSAERERRKRGSAD